MSINSQFFQPPSPKKPLQAGQDTISEERLREIADAQDADNVCRYVGHHGLWDGITEAVKRADAMERLERALRLITPDRI